MDFVFPEVEDFGCSEEEGGVLSVLLTLRAEKRAGIASSSAKNWAWSFRDLVTLLPLGFFSALLSYEMKTKIVYI